MADNVIDEKRCMWNRDSGFRECRESPRYIFYDGNSWDAKPVVAVCADHKEETENNLKQQGKPYNIGILANNQTQSERLKLLEAAVKALTMDEAKLLYRGEKFLQN